MAEATAAKKAAKSNTNGAPKDDGLAPLRLLSKERLIADAVTCLTTIENAKAQYERICTVLEDHFDLTKASDHIITEFGVAERQVAATWLVKPGKEKELKKILGKMYGEWITEKETVTVVKGKEAELAEKLGATWKKYFLFKTDYKVDPKLRNAIKRGDNELASKVVDLIEVVEKTTVKVKPVERDKAKAA
jgi:hypothetical protein